MSGVIAELTTAGLVPYSAAKAGISAGFRAVHNFIFGGMLQRIAAASTHTS